VAHVLVEQAERDRLQRLGAALTCVRTSMQ
jgi:hypothetical protein